METPEKSPVTDLVPLGDDQARTEQIARELIEKAVPGISQVATDNHLAYLNNPENTWPMEREYNTGLGGAQPQVNTSGPNVSFLFVTQ